MPVSSAASGSTKAPTLEAIRTWGVLGSVSTASTSLPPLKSSAQAPSRPSARNWTVPTMSASQMVRLTRTVGPFSASQDGTVRIKP